MPVNFILQRRVSEGMSWAQNLCLHLQINMAKLNYDGRLFATNFFTNSISEKTEKFIFSTNYIGT